MDHLVEDQTRKKLNMVHCLLELQQKNWIGKAQALPRGFLVSL